MKIFKAFNRKFNRKDLYECQNTLTKSHNKENSNQFYNKVNLTKNNTNSNINKQIIETLYIIERMKK